jgi:protein-S-isoprenylcysteine O-methyltransferase Ste14
VIIISLAVVGVVIFGGIMLRVVVRANQSDTEKWERVSPFIYIGCGLVTLVAGWFQRGAGIPAVIIMLGGAVMAGSGAFFALRNHAKGSKSAVQEDD